MTNDLNNQDTPNLQKFLKENSNWTIVHGQNQKFLASHNELIREYEFSSRNSTMEFVNAILKLAEKQDHDPTLIVEWHKVTLVWSTHSKKAVTDLDLEMAIRSDEIYKKMN